MYTIILIYILAVDNIEKKIKNLQTQYTRESQKTKKKKSGAGTDEVYSSKWPYMQCVKKALRQVFLWEVLLFVKLCLDI